MRLLIAGAQGQLARAMIELAPAAPDVTAFAWGGLRSISPPPPRC